MRSRLASTKSWTRRRAAGESPPRRCVFLAGDDGRASHFLSLPDLPLLHFAGTDHERAQDRKIARRIATEQPATVFTQRRPDALDPLARMLGELDAAPFSPARGGGAHNLRVADGRWSRQWRSLRAWRAAVNWSIEAGPPKSSIVMHGKSRAIEGEDLRRDVVEGSRFLLEPHDFACRSVRRSRRVAEPHAAGASGRQAPAVSFAHHLKPVAATP